MRSTWIWHTVGLTNVLLFLQQSWVRAWPADHLWSLDVEWQFYLVWPALIFLAPNRLLPYVFVITFLIGPLYRFLAIHDSMWTLPFASMDSLGAGSLLAIYRGPAWPVYAIGWAAAPLVVYGLLKADQLSILGSSFTFAALVLGGWRGDLKHLDRQSLVRLGKISYGVYLYHLFIWAALYPLGFVEPGPLLFFSLTSFTIIVSLISYTYFEAPLRLWGKHYFNAPHSGLL